MVLPLAACLVFGVGCKHASKPPAEAHDHDHGHGPSDAQAVEGLVRLKVPPPRLEYRWMPGEATGDESATAVLASPVKGLVGRLRAAPGQPVGAGALLAQVQSPELARLSAEWLSAKAALERARSEAAREARLFDAGAGARRDLEAARNEVAAAQAAEAAARLGLEAVGLRTGEAGATLSVKAP
ncbi:MAG TPA: efflux RND transporter periplasmic adaptor subunit, partial [Holophaga sp.]|nr:efflux RND transporter periplasmic adaptor subunit [Holophaga sp.]